MRAMVLCAGRGTRLGKLGEGTPKPLLPIEGRPLIAYTLKHLAACGFRRVVINLHFMAEKIRSVCGDGSAFGLEIAYSHEETLLGTAGGPKHAAYLLAPSREFLLLYGDVLTDQDFAAMVNAHRERGADATLLLHQREGSNSLVQMDAAHHITGFIERPTEAQRKAHPYPWVNSGVYVLSTELLKEIPDGVPWDFPRDVFPGLIGRRRIMGFPLSDYRCAIDWPERYDEARAAVADERYRSPF